MIDIHSHILAQTDDGPPSIEESVQMCKASADDGITVMVATPHSFDSVHKTHPVDVLATRVAELNNRLGGRPKIVLGCELRFTHDVVNQVCAQKTAPTIAGGPYVLLEFPHSMVPVGTERVLFELMSNRITPIIAHPERNRVLMAEPARFLALVEMGVLGQIDSGSVLGQFGSSARKAARIMLESNMVHFIASDCHNMRNRLPGLSEAVKEVAEIIGEDGARMISTGNPAAVVEGKPAPWRPAPRPPEKKKKWFFFG
ncbi:MAG TPA: CpsB/CapC family capsule biosynthesis tyrosine phosphatase [Blastocatellia bacterium]